MGTRNRKLRCGSQCMWECLGEPWEPYDLASDNYFEAKNAFDDTWKNHSKQRYRKQQRNPQMNPKPTRTTFECEVHYKDTRVAGYKNTL